MQGTSFNTEGSAGPVRAALDEANLLAYLQRTAPAALPPSPRLSVRQFAHGQSNPTYLLTLTAGEGGQQAGVSKLVLRKKPPGVILASAHAVEREYQVISALHAQRSVPVSGQLHNSPLCRGCHYENLTTGKRVALVHRFRVPSSYVKMSGCWARLSTSCSSRRAQSSW